MLDFLVDEHLNLLSVDTQLLEEEVRHVLRLLQHAFQDMYRFDDLLAIQLCGIDGLLNSLLCFDCKLV